MGWGVGRKRKMYPVQVPSVNTTNHVHKNAKKKFKKKAGKVNY